MTGFLDKINKSAQEFKEMIQHPEPQDLCQYEEYQCYAEFQCMCGRKWQSILAWGVYGTQNEDKCDCLSMSEMGSVTKGTSRRCFHHVTVDAERLAKVGCVHRLFDLYECKEDHSVDRRQWLPLDDAKPPQQGCKNCHRWTQASVCELLWDQPGHGRHIPEECPKCIHLRRWCAGSLHKADVLLRYRVLAELVTPGMEWLKSESGLETEIRYKGFRVLLQILGFFENVTLHYLKANFLMMVSSYIVLRHHVLDGESKNQGFVRTSSASLNTGIVGLPQVRRSNFCRVTVLLQELIP